MTELWPQIQYTAWTVIKITCILVPIILGVAYSTYLERKVIAYMHARVGPNRVGVLGLLQPLADVVKLLLKEIIIPHRSNWFLFILAPFFTLVPALIAWAVLPFDENLILANINAAILYVFAMSSLGVYGILISGWASNSKYAFLGSLRAAAQTVSYEIAMGFALVSVLLAAGSMNLREIVLAQQGGVWHWFVIPLFPVFLVYWVSGVAETNRLPFDLAEGESEIVAGFHVEYAGVTFALFFLAEYANMLLISFLAATMFMGGWLSPFEGIPVLGTVFSWVPGVAWLGIKGLLFMILYFWLRATWPRYRYDQVMRLGWKVLIPLSLVWVVVVAVMVQLNWLGGSHGGY